MVSLGSWNVPEANSCIDLALEDASDICGQNWALTPMLARLASTVGWEFPCNGGVPAAALWLEPWEARPKVSPPL
ncbi:MAG: hypothetical protein FD129_2105 [bacterium]|nr:MAG: hypothetical protein FD129_2105 [bacterium]